MIVNDYNFVQIKFQAQTRLDDGETSALGSQEKGEIKGLKLGSRAYKTVVEKDGT